MPFWHPESIQTWPVVMEGGSGIVTRTKAQGGKAALTSFQTIAVFLITKPLLQSFKIMTRIIHEAYMMVHKVIDQIKTLHEAYMMVHKVIDQIKTLRRTIDSTFGFLYAAS